MLKHAQEIKSILDTHDFDEETKAALVRYFEFSAHKYYQLRNALAVFACIITVGCSVGIQQGAHAGKAASGAIATFKKESKQRRDQSCKLTEGTYKRNVENLKLTYRYIESLGAEDIKQPLNQLIIRQIPKNYADAKASIAPAFCNEPGVGLPEPTLKLPPLKDFSALINKQ